MTQRTESEDEISQRTDIATWFAALRISAVVAGTALALVYLVPHPVVSAHFMRTLGALQLALACTALTCAVGADVVSKRRASLFAAASVFALALWFALALVALWLSWSGQDWIRIGHTFMSGISVAPVILAVMILYGSVNFGARA